MKTIDQTTTEWIDNYYYLGSAVLEVINPSLSPCVNEIVVIDEQERKVIQIIHDHYAGISNIYLD